MFDRYTTAPYIPLLKSTNQTKTRRLGVTFACAHKQKREGRYPAFARNSVIGRQT